MSLKVTDSCSPIVQPSTYFKNLLLNLKVRSVASFINNLLKISFEQICINFLSNRVLSIKEIVAVVHITLVKPNVMRRLDDGINIMI